MGLVTMKFGGTSVGDADAIANVVKAVQKKHDQGHQVVVVVSAMTKVTDWLHESAQVARQGGDYLSCASQIRNKHQDVIDHFFPEGAAREHLAHEIHDLINRYVDLCQAIDNLTELNPRIIDRVVSYGERLSCRLVAAVMQKHGIDAIAMDATELLITTAEFQNAEPILDITRQRVQDRLMPHVRANKTPIITGYIGATADGLVTTLGRGGSDYSAAIFAAMTDSDELIIWTDVDGIMTADPRLLGARTRLLPTISYQEMCELAFYGAMVLHPKTIQPILNMKTRLSVRNTHNLDAPGTQITVAGKRSDTVVRAVTVIENVSMLTVSGLGMLGVPGIAGRMFSASASAGASILMISQASSEQSVCFVVKDESAAQVKASIERELAPEIQHHNVDDVIVDTDIVIMTAVGWGMVQTPGVAGRIFTQLGDHSINVRAIAHGASACSISFVVAQDNMTQALTMLHELALEHVDH